MNLSSESNYELSKIEKLVVANAHGNRLNNNNIQTSCTVLATACAVLALLGGFFAWLLPDELAKLRVIIVSNKYECVGLLSTLIVVFITTYALTVSKQLRTAVVLIGMLVLFSCLVLWVNQLLSTQTNQVKTQTQTPTPTPQIELPESLTNSIGMEFHKVDLCEGRTLPADFKPFMMASVKMSQRHWREFRSDDAPCAFIGDDLPVHGLTLREAQAVCQQLSDLDSERRAGRSYRLQNLCEYLAALGDDPMAWMKNATVTPSGKFTSLDGPRGVASTPARFGLRELIGNMREWATDETCTEGQVLAVGGSYLDRPETCLYKRNDFQAMLRNRHDRSDISTIGLRIVCELGTAK